MKTMLRGIVRPLVERVGTMLAAYLIAQGLDSDLTAQLMNAAVAFVFVALDLAVSAVFRERDLTRAVYDAEYRNIAARLVNTGHLHRQEGD